MKRAKKYLRYCEKYFTEYPFTLVDVGFRDGVQNRWLFLKKFLNVIGFEPEKEEYERLIRKHSYDKIFNTGLYNQKTEIDFFITRDGNLCSFLEPDRTVLDEFPDTERFDVLNKISLPVDTLDNVLSVQSGEREIKPDFVKLDTQGTELYILEGMTETLNKAVFGLEVEVEFIPMYLKQPLFNEVDIFVQKHGFRLFDLRRYYWKRRCGLGFDDTMRGQVIHGEALYFREPNHYLNILRTNDYDSIEMKASLFKAVASTLVFGYSDYSICLLQKGLENKIISGKEYSHVSNIVKVVSLRNVSLPNFKGKGLLGRILNKLFLSSHRGWAMWDRPYLGNI